MIFFLPGEKGIAELVLSPRTVGAPGAGNPCSVLDGDALPALGEGGGEAGIGVGVRLNRRAKHRHIVVRERHEFSGHRVEGGDLGVVGLTEANGGEGAGEGAGEAH
jgi:hypothetical protein